MSDKIPLSEIRKKRFGKVEENLSWDETFRKTCGPAPQDQISSFPGFKSHSPFLSGPVQLKEIKRRDGEEV